MRIAVHGYTLQAVGDDEHQPWVYTIGLVESADHPELIIAGASVETSARILNAFAEAVIDGERYEVGETIRVPGRSIRFGAVHEVQYDLDTFAGWHELSSVGVIDSPDLTAIQMVLDDSFFCRHHRHEQPDLSDPQARVGAALPRPNRAERRRRKRR